ncbi:MAG: cytochrome b/b6 domain protein [Acidimicrobiales bacterium]|nr:cytochrome b/b6 domain protein [Acidimicrobiales bacterium]
MIKRLVRWVDNRVGTTKFTRKTLNKVFPDHWSFMLGEVALYCFVVLIATGVFLTFFFHPSAERVIYTGSYAPLRGLDVSESYSSALHISFDVRSGLLIRQIHHWAALVFLAAIVVHLCRVFFTGAFRRPREINWYIGLLLLLLSIANGFAGYSLPDDLLSGTGVRIMYSILLSVPVIGTWLAFLVFGGEYPAHDITSRLFILHVLIVPAVIVGMLTAHLAIIWRQKHTQFRGTGRTEGNVVGSRLWPTYALRSVGLFFVVTAVLAALGGLFQINPIWLYGPYEPSAVTTAAQPDWYMGWLEGALRLIPRLHIQVFGYRVPEILVPGVIFPTLTFGVLFCWPAVEKLLTRDRSEHHLLDRPRDRPLRTALGTAVLTFYVVLFIGGGQDIIAQKFNLTITDVTMALRISLLVMPLVVAAITYKLCRDLAHDKPLAEAIEEAEPPQEPAPEADPQPPNDPVATASSR